MSQLFEGRGRLGDFVFARASAVCPIALTFAALRGAVNPSFGARRTGFLGIALKEAMS